MNNREPRDRHAEVSIFVVDMKMIRAVIILVDECFGYVTTST